MDDQSRPHTTDDLTDADARAFVASSGLQPDESESHLNEQPKSPPTSEARVMQAVKEAQMARTAYNKARPIAVYVAVGLILALIVVASVALAKPKNNASSSSSGGILSVPTPDSAGSNGLSKQTQQDINTCSNVVNAALEC